MISVTTHWLFTMELAARLIQLRKQKGLSQQALADAVGLHVTQIKRYESGATQPSLDALKKIALTFGVSTDFLLFDEAERGPDDELRLQFDVIARLDDDERHVIRELIDGMIIKYQTRRWDTSRAAAPPPTTKTPAAKPATKRATHAAHR
jgi:transcriptional regulator with XRE-family HTH domain